MFAQIDAGQVELTGDCGFVPRWSRQPRSGAYRPRLVPKGQRRLGGRDDMNISLYAGGMTIRDIQHHLASTLGTDLAHETISNITDAVLEEVAAWQARPLEEFYPVIYLDAIRIKIRESSQVISRAADRAWDCGKPASQRKAQGRLIEGQIVTYWKQALAQLAAAYPGRITPYL